MGDNCDGVAIWRRVLPRVAVGDGSYVRVAVGDGSYARAAAVAS